MATAPWFYSFPNIRGAIPELDTFGFAAPKEAYGFPMDQPQLSQIQLAIRVCLIVGF
jgi:hypothetical protein